jgi:hypothetical protein
MKIAGGHTTYFNKKWGWTNSKSWFEEYYELTDSLLSLFLKLLLNLDI